MAGDGGLHNSLFQMFLFHLSQAVPSLFCWWTSLSLLSGQGVGEGQQREVATHSEDKHMGNNIILPAFFLFYLTP